MIETPGKMKRKETYTTIIIVKNEKRSR